MNLEETKIILILKYGSIADWYWTHACTIAASELTSTELFIITEYIENDRNPKIKSVVENACK